MRVCVRGFFFEIISLENIGTQYHFWAIIVLCRRTPSDTTNFIIVCKLYKYVLKLRDFFFFNLYSNIYKCISKYDKHEHSTINVVSFFYIHKQISKCDKIK